MCLKAFYCIDFLSFFLCTMIPLVDIRHFAMSIYMKNWDFYHKLAIRNWVSIAQEYFRLSNNFPIRLHQTFHRKIHLLFLLRFCFRQAGQDYKLHQSQSQQFHSLLASPTRVSPCWLATRCHLKTVCISTLQDSRLWKFGNRSIFLRIMSNFPVFRVSFNVVNDRLKTISFE